MPETLPLSTPPQKSLESIDVIPWAQVLLLCTVPIAASVSAMNFAPVLPLIADEFALNNTWSGVLASATTVAQLVLQTAGGRVADTLGAKRSLGLGLVIIGVFVAASGLADDFALLLLCRILIGVGTAMSFIAGLSFADTLVPASRRTSIQGIYGSAAPMGVLLTFLTSERLASWVGWRGSFVVEGVLILGIALLIFTRLRPSAPPALAHAASWSHSFRQLPLYLLGIAGILTYGIAMGFCPWGAVFLWRQHGVDLAWAGPLASLLMVSAVLGRSLGGALAIGRERQVILASCIATAVLTAALPFAPGLIPALLVLIAIGWFANVSFGPLFSYPSLLARKGASGLDLGLINTVGLTGVFAFPPAIGYALDATGSFTLGLEALAAIGLLGSFTLVLFLPKPRVERVEPQAPSQDGAGDKPLRYTRGI